MTTDSWLIVAIGVLWVLASFSGAIADWWYARRRRRAADELTALWNDERYFDA